MGRQADRSRDDREWSRTWTVSGWGELKQAAASRCQPIVNQRGLTDRQDEGLLTSEKGTQSLASTTHIHKHASHNKS